MKPKALIGFGVLCIVVGLQNCGGGTSGNTLAKNGPNDGRGSGPSTPAPSWPVLPVAFAAGYVEHDGDKAAYVLSVDTDIATLYIPSVDRYARVSVTTGKYQKHSVHYSDENCTGVAVATFFHGEIGKSVIFFKEKYYRITEPLVGQFSYRSYFVEYDFPSIHAPDGCFSYSTATHWPYLAYSFEEVERPYDFESIAPLTIKFE